jgi:hypothetical protein
MPGEKCIQGNVIMRAREQADSESRYRVVLEWLLQNLQDDRTSADGR